ncbi:MAG: hypothetical protein AAGE94_03895 [Acidobacteriota bacterium]
MAEAFEATPRRLLDRFVVTALGTASLLAAIGWVPTRRLAGEDGPTAMILALVVALASSGLGTLPVWAVRNKQPRDTVPAQLGAMALRLVALLILAAAVALLARPALQPFLLWLVLAHAALLVADTFFARGIIQASVEREGRSTRDTNDPNP